MTYIQPLLLLFLLLGLAGWWHLRRRTKQRSLLLTVSLAGIFLIAWPPSAWLSSYLLEGWYPAAPPVLDGAAAIVVLSGNVEPPSSEYPANVPAWDTYQRCHYAAWIHRSQPTLPVLASGGGSGANREPFAVAMRQLLIELGVPADKILIEDRSTSTYENAVKSVPILKARGITKIALVTQAYHMLRAERCFRKLGMEVVPAPCGFQRPSLEIDSFLPSWQPIRSNERALHEIVGLTWYWILRRV